VADNSKSHFFVPPGDAAMLDRTPMFLDGLSSFTAKLVGCTVGTFSEGAPTPSFATLHGSGCVSRQFAHLEDEK